MRVYEIRSRWLAVVSIEEEGAEVLEWGLGSQRVGPDPLGLRKLRAKQMAMKILARGEAVDGKSDDVQAS